MAISCLTISCLAIYTGKNLIHSPMHTASEVQAPNDFFLVRESSSERIFRKQGMYQGLKQPKFLAIQETSSIFRIKNRASSHQKFVYAMNILWP